MPHVEAKHERQRRQEGRPVTAPQLTVQVIGLEPQHVRVVEQRINSNEPAVFVELGGENCKVTLAGRLNRLQQLTAEMGHQLAQLEEAHRGDAGQ
jgi:hypothetical protein